MSYYCDDFLIKEKNALAKDIYSFTVYCPEAAAAAKCGQFVHIRAEGFTLRRPVSICRVDREKGTIRIVFAVKGEGTAEIARLNKGDRMNMIAPLGNGFSSAEIPQGKRVLLVSGGIGVPPMLETARRHISRNDSVTALLGFRGYGNIILADEFEKMGVQTVICTDDGSVGIKGTIAGPMRAELEKEDIGAVFACGPKPMLKAVAELANEYDVFCELSLEERMACGVGACVGCAARIKRDGGEKLLRVCKDGPVFNAAEVIF